MRLGAPSTVQRQIRNVVAVRWCSEIPANKPILSGRLSWLFAVVRVGWCTTSVLEDKIEIHPLLLFEAFPADQPFFGVEPRGFEPLTSAVQRRPDSLPELSRVCKTPANSCICSSALFSRFQTIHSGCCTVAAQQVSEHC